MSLPEVAVQVPAVDRRRAQFYDTLARDIEVLRGRVFGPGDPQAGHVVYLLGRAACAARFAARCSEAKEGDRE